jgi:hypothetical protein
LEPGIRPVIIRNYLYMRLRVIPSLAPREADPFEPADGVEMVARPAEAREPWELQSSATLRAVAEEAHACGLPLPVAVSLVCELRLVLGDVGRPVVGALDRAARAGCVEARLSAADAAYLRLLTVGRRDRHDDVGRRVCTVDIPSRLSSRLLNCGGPERLLERGWLERACEWECAAVLEGRTMSEWAALTRLRVSQR